MYELSATTVVRRHAHIKFLLICVVCCTSQFVMQMRNTRCKSNEMFAVCFSSGSLLLTSISDDNFRFEWNTRMCGLSDWKEMPKKTYRMAIRTFSHSNYAGKSLRFVPAVVFWRGLNLNIQWFAEIDIRRTRMILLKCDAYGSIQQFNSFYAKGKSDLIIYCGTSNLCHIHRMNETQKTQNSVQRELKLDQFCGKCQQHVIAASIWIEMNMKCSAMPWINLVKFKETCHVDNIKIIIFLWWIESMQRTSMIRLGISSKRKQHTHAARVLRSPFVLGTMIVERTVNSDLINRI